MQTNEQTNEQTQDAVDQAEADAYVQALLGANSTLQAGSIQFLKFSKGDWLLGREEQTFENNQFDAIINVPKMVIGYQCWKDKNVVDEAFASLGQPPVDRDTLTDHGPYSQQGDGWQESCKFQLFILPQGKIVQPIYSEFSTSSNGGLGAVRKFNEQYIQGIRAGNFKKLPVVRFSVDSYNHKTYGKIKTPKFEIVRWAEAAEAKAIGVQMNIALPKAVPSTPAPSPSQQAAPDVPELQVPGL
jgi:hypothetical protein